MIVLVERKVKEFIHDGSFSSRTLTYCIWNLMAGEDQQDVKQERVPLPPPTKRRDHHLRECHLPRRKRMSIVVVASMSVGQVGFGSGEDIAPVNAFGIGFNADAAPPYK
jgi:hypothetical protein